jgi:hypothetical protein
VLLHKIVLECIGLLLHMLLFNISIISSIGGATGTDIINFLQYCFFFNHYTTANILAPVVVLSSTNTSLLHFDYDHIQYFS